ncbi:MAG: DNA repair protein, partial [Bdellovibrionales bacterium]|nr:DNA repair protein [Bdellovibrionales bacterium]
IHPRDLFRFGCQTNASSLVIAHNHPNASPVPSESDLKLTSRLVEAGNLMQIPVVDHLILSRHSYLSFRDLGWIEAGKRNQSLFHGYK